MLYLLGLFYEVSCIFKDAKIGKKTNEEQNYIDYIASHLDVKLEITSHLNEGLPSGKLILTNLGNSPIAANVESETGELLGVWGMYICIMSYMEPNTLRHQTYSLMGSNQQMKMSHPDGRIWKIEPTENYSALKPSEWIRMLPLSTIPLSSK